jgi:probable phosphoglycerate mutase
MDCAAPDLTTAGQQPYELPAHATRLLIARHGAAAVVAPDAEPLGLLDGYNDPPLAASGRAQAAALCARLELERPERIFITDLQRTAESAAPLAAALGIEPEVVPELREVHLGEWEGQYAHRVAVGDPHLDRLLAEERWDVIPGAEANDAFRRRVAAGVERLIDATGPGATAAVFAHGGTIAEICRHATNSRPLVFFYSENASVTELAHLGDERWLLRSFNDIRHLVC